MFTSFMPRQLARWVLVGGLMLSVSAMLVRAQPTPDVRQRFLTEAPEQWRAVEQFAAKVQGKVTVSVTVQIPQRKINDTDTIRYSVRQNGRCAMLRGSPVQTRRNDPVEYVFLSNTQYAAQLRRDPGKSGEFMLKSYDPNPDAQLLPAPSSIRRWAFVTLFPHFCYHDQPLAEVIHQPGFRLENVTLDERGLVRAKVRYERSIPNGTGKMIAETIFTFDPQRYWCIREYQEESTYKVKSGNTTSQYVVEFVLEDHSSGFPLVRRQDARSTATSTSSGGNDNRRRVEYELQVDESVPDSEFTMSAFGLPEPVGVVWERRTPVYVWLFVAAGVLLTMGIFFRWLARRLCRGHSEG
jgi:hypothetical protein